MVKFLSIGEIMLEMSDVGDSLYRKGYAGDTFNVAYYMTLVAQSSFKADYLTAIGTDKLSDECIEFLSATGISTSWVRRDPQRTIGLFILSNDEKGEKRYSYWRGQSAARRLFDQPLSLNGFDYVYLSGITTAVTENRENLLASLKQAKEGGSKIVFDVNYRPLLWNVEEASAVNRLIYDIADLIKLSDDELALLHPGISIEKLSHSYPSVEWVLTCAGEKAEVLQDGVVEASHSFTPVKNIVDSSAAGDAFLAVYLQAKISGCSADKAIVRAHRAASQVICHKGSIAPVDLSKLD